MDSLRRKTSQNGCTVCLTGKLALSSKDTSAETEEFQEARTLRLLRVRSSHKLIEHVRTLLLRLGIDSTVNQAKGKSGFKASGPQWVLHIGRNEGKMKFISSVGFMQKDKNAGIWISRIRYERFPLSWRRIRSITPQANNHRRVYDLSVSGTERFITNGMLAHNSVRWLKTIPEAEPVLLENLLRFTKGKKPEDGSSMS